MKTTENADRVTAVSGKNLNLTTHPTDGAVILPLYSSLSPSQQVIYNIEELASVSPLRILTRLALLAPHPCSQQQIFLPLPSTAHRRIIISTNIAETSLTLENVIYVIDSGLEKKKTLGSTGVGVLKTEVISKASAIQRSGR